MACPTYQSRASVFDNLGIRLKILQIAPLRIYMFLRLAPLVVYSVSISSLNQDMVTPFQTTLQVELFGDLYEPVSNQSSVEQCLLFLPRILSIVYIPPNRCTAVLHHFVINCYFILYKIDLSTTDIFVITFRKQL